MIDTKLLSLNIRHFLLTILYLLEELINFFGIEKFTRIKEWIQAYNNIVHINEKFKEVWPHIANLVGISNPTSVFLEDVEISLVLVHV